MSSAFIWYTNYYSTVSNEERLEKNVIFLKICLKVLKSAKNVTLVCKEYQANLPNMQIIILSLTTNE